MVWNEWHLHGALVQNAWGLWEVNPARDGEWWVYGAQRDHAHSLLKDSLSRTAAPPFTLEEAETILNCTAVEGEVFTVRPSQRPWR